MIKMTEAEEKLANELLNDNDCDKICAALKKLANQVEGTMSHVRSDSQADHRQSYDIASRLLAAHM